jgi:hypothetical protein
MRGRKIAKPPNKFPKEREIIMNNDSISNVSDVNGSNNSTDGAMEVPVSNDKVRTRTSPRSKAFDEALAVIAHFTAEWENEEDGESVVEVLNTLTSQLSIIRDKGPQGPQGSIGKHYVVKGFDNSLSHFQTTARVSKTSHGNRFAQVFGPFRFKDAAMWRVANGLPENELTEKALF